MRRKIAALACLAACLASLWAAHYTATHHALWVSISYAFGAGVWFCNSMEKFIVSDP